MSHPDNNENQHHQTSIKNVEHMSTSKITPILAGISVLLLVWMLQSVLAPFIFASILAALTWPIRDRIFKWTRGKANLTSGILILGIILLIGLPVGAILLLAFGQFQEFIKNFNVHSAQTWMISLGDRLDHLSITNQVGLTTQNLLPKLQDAMSDIASWGMGVAMGVGSSILHTLILLGITLMSLFYLYVSGDSFVNRLKNIVPLPNSQVVELLEVFRRTSKAIFKGNFVIGGTQGLLTGLLFWGTGLPSPAFFGVVAAMASLIPAVGTGLVWAPAMLYFVISGDFTRASIVLCVGAGVISMIDSLMRPVLVGRDAGMHDLMVFLTTLGGLSFFGPVGVLFGPLVGAGVLAMIRIYEENKSIPASNLPDISD